jgi:hypothetical protein
MSDGWSSPSTHARRRGVGRALMTEAMRRFPPGPAVVEVMTFGPDHPGASASGARAFYERLGFTAAEAAAWLHEIGYTPGLATTGLHALDGARYLRDAHHADTTLCRLVQTTPAPSPKPPNADSPTS